MKSIPAVAILVLTLSAVGCRPPEPSPDPLPPFYEPLPDRSPSASTQVAEAQRLLNALGHDTGAVDGVLGPRTRQTVIEFQQRQGLVETGRVSRTLLVQLRRAVRESRAGKSPEVLPGEDGGGGDETRAPPGPGGGSLGRPATARWRLRSRQYSRTRRRWSWTGASSARRVTAPRCKSAPGSARAPQLRERDLVLFDDTVSRVHAVIERQQPGRFVIKDEGSTNGVLVDNRRIDKVAPLEDGAIIEVGEVPVRFLQLA